MKYINTEAMIIAANIMDNAADSMLRAASQMDDCVHRLTLLLGQGYGSNLEIMIEQLEKLNALAVPKQDQSTDLNGKQS